MIETCPTEAGNAPPERVWELLTNPAHYASWTDTTPVDARARAITVGERVALRAGPGGTFRVVWEVLEMAPPRELRLDIRLRFGMVNHETVRIAALDGARCRVTFG